MTNKLIEFNTKWHKKYDEMEGTRRFLLFINVVAFVIFLPFLISLGFGISEENQVLAQIISLVILSIAGASRIIYLNKIFRKK